VLSQATMIAADEVPTFSPPFSGVKSFLKRSNSDTQRQSWRQWAGQKFKLRRRRIDDGETLVTDSERITLFPGWATRTRRYGDADSGMFEVSYPTSSSSCILFYLLTERSQKVLI
jgi:hypothetical protein